jgi:hypothetical protein
MITIARTNCLEPQGGFLPIDHRIQTDCEHAPWPGDQDVSELEMGRLRDSRQRSEEVLRHLS